MEFILVAILIFIIFWGLHLYYKLVLRLETFEQQINDRLTQDWDRTDWSQDRKDQNIHKHLKDLDKRFTEDMQGLATTDQQLFDQLAYATLWQISIEVAYANNSTIDFQTAMKYAKDEQALMVGELKAERDMSDNQVNTYLNIRKGTNPASYHQGTY